MVTRTDATPRRGIFGMTKADLGIAAAVFLGVCICAIAGIELTRGTGRIATIWIANAVTVAILAYAVPRRWPVILASSYLAGLAGNAVAGNGFWLSALLTACNMAEVVVCAALITHRFEKVDFTRPAVLIYFSAVAAGSAALLSAILAGLTLSTVEGIAFFPVATTWFAADALGLVVITPAVATLWTLRGQGLPTLRTTSGALVSYAMLGATFAAVFLQESYPFLFLVFPALLFVAFEAGFFGAAVAVLMVGAGSVLATFHDFGPLALIDGDLREKVIILQVFVATGAVKTLLVAAVLSERRILENQLRQARRAAEELIAAEQQARSLLNTTLDAMDQGLIVIAADDTMPIVNRRATELLRLPDFVGLGTATHSDVLAFQAARGDLVAVPDDVRPFITEPHRFLTMLRFEAEQADGLVIETRSSPIPNGGIVRTFTDISARRKAERLVEERERLYRLLAENTSDLISRVDLDGTRTYVSPSCRQLLGYEPAEMTSGIALDLVHPDDSEKAKVNLGALFRGETDYLVCTYRVRRRDGTYVFLESHSKLVRDPITRMPTEVVASARDVTQREQRTRELSAAQAATEAALQRAEQANEAKSAFLATMSHEIRTPLNSILGFTELMLDEQGQAAPLRRQIQLVRNAGQMLVAILNDILDFSRVEAGELVLSPDNFALGPFIDGIASIVRSSAVEKGLRFETELEPNLSPWLLGDSTRLGQVLLNLVNNAVKFTNAGSVTVRVTSEPAPSDRVGVRFTVTDTGIGTPADKRDRLFRRFSQVDDTVQRRFGGSGLGLAICKALVELMGGAIGVESRDGERSTFWFTIALPPGREEDITGDSRADAGAIRPLRILLAEDLLLNQEIAAKLLSRDGHAIEVVSDGREAIEAARNGRYDLILMDIQMPEVDGITAMRAIRAMDGPPGRVPIVAMTANVLQHQVAEFMRAGFSDHLGKPFSREQLRAMVARASPVTDGGAGQAGGPHDPSFDEAAFEAFKGLFEPDRMVGHLEAFGQMMREIPAEVTDREETGRKAHSLVSLAGMLGFARLARLSAELETACRDGADVTATLNAFAAEREDAERRAADLRSAA